MAGFDNDVVYAGNVDFRGVKPVVGQMTTNGQLLIGSTAAPHIKVGSLASADGSVTITTGSGTIDLSAPATPGVITTTFGSPTTSGSFTWTKNANTKYVKVFVWHGGSSGASGRCGASTAAGGGGGGNGNGGFQLEGPINYFASPVTVVVGAGGSLVAGVGPANSNGNPGNISGVSSWGAITAGSNTASTGGTTTTAAGSGGGALRTGIATQVNDITLGATGRNTAGDAGASSNWGQAHVFGGGTGGGGGGADAVTPRAGGNGGGFSEPGGSIIIAGGNGGIETGTIDGSPGVAGTGSGIVITGGTGAGAGGGQSSGLVAGNGGKGGWPGGGGGGGGGSITGTTSGSGGAGGNGAVIVVEFL